MSSPEPDVADWRDLVARTRWLVRSVGLVAFDESFDYPERYCELDEVESATLLKVGVSLVEPDAFRNYLTSAIALLVPLGPGTARKLLDGLNERLAEPLRRLELHEGEQRFDLLSAGPYAAVDIARYTLISILHQLGWGPEPGPDSGISPEDEPLVDDLLGQIAELETDPRDHISYGPDEDEPRP